MGPFSSRAGKIKFFSWMRSEKLINNDRNQNSSYLRSGLDWESTHTQNFWDTERVLYPALGRVIGLYAYFKIPSN